MEKYIWGAHGQPDTLTHRERLEAQDMVQWWSEATLEDLPVLKVQVFLVREAPVPADQLYELWFESDETLTEDAQDELVAIRDYALLTRPDVFGSHVLSYPESAGERERLLTMRANEESLIEMLYLVRGYER